MSNFSEKLSKRKNNFKKKTNRLYSIEKRSKQTIFNSVSKRENLMNEKRVFSLQNFEQSQTAFEKSDALCILNNILMSTEEHTEKLVKAGILKVLTELISTIDDFELIENVLLCLTNIVEDSNRYCAELVENNFIKSILNFFSQEYPVNIIRCGTWLLLNICKGASFLYHAPLLKSIIQIFNSLLQIDDDIIKKNSCKGIEALSIQKNAISLFLSEQVINNLLSLLINMELIQYKQQIQILDTILIIIGKCSANQLSQILEFKLLQVLLQILEIKFTPLLYQKFIQIIFQISLRGEHFIGELFNSDLLKLIIDIANSKINYISNENFHLLIKMIRIWNTKAQYEHCIWINTAIGIKLLANFLQKKKHVNLEILFSTLTIINQIIQSKNGKLISLMENFRIFHLVKNYLQDKDEQIRLISNQILDTLQRTGNTSDIVEEIELEEEEKI
ncbi:importin subunit alpha-b [Anaeramoeba flamelloides]|uniref:Importin subunit alpha-b n=1 Tax=Anaeramoeba flamelloides TaxID=1746091 RepID=A0ABQ8X6F8_9EUKA|nr:importin subunit alpha-b [Anaeramoeba flamelloides]